MTEQTYTAKNIKRPDQITHVRMRIGMYLGGVDSRGLTTGLRELIDNSFDEGLSGHGDTVITRFYADNSAEVQDFGRGLPVDSNDEGINGIILTIGTVGSGGKFSGETISGGLNGVGASATNAAASRLDCTVYRDGKQYQLSFRQGLPGFFNKEDDPNAKFTPNTELKVSKDPRPAAEQKKHPSGTKVRYWPDHTIFMEDAVFLVEDIKNRLKASCFLLPNMTAIVEDYRHSADHPEIMKYHFNSGIEEMIPTLTNSSLMTKTLLLESDTSFVQDTNVLGDEGLTRQAVTRPVNIKVAFAYSQDEDTVLNSYVNLIQTRQGGTHEKGLWRGVSRALINHIKEGKEAKYLKAKEEPPITEDVKDGFVGAVAVSFPEPTFSGQAKEELNTPQMESLVSKATADELKLWLNNPKNKNEVKKICSRIVEAARIRIESKKQKDTARKKSALETSSSMPDKLVDCADAGVNSKNTELFLVEGDSALGSMRQARMAENQALLPLRGKVRNTWKAGVSAILSDAECSNMIKTIGAGSTKSFDINEMRYERIIIATDADVDGAHIAVLLMTFFYRTMRELVTSGRLYMVVPPLFELRYRVKGKEHLEYVIDETERDVRLAELKKQRVGEVSIGRNKGLGEMDAEDVWPSLMNPETRVLKRISIEDLERAETILELAMGPKADPRKEWISTKKIPE